ncbi:MAG: bL21 family ribosomal protein, partial [Deltaproteobacteria bacterium]|nr:bL21 family ribosomal protein [Deltaproteobacteria bacterium]
AQATLTVEVVQQTRGEKLLTIKYKRRKGYRRMIGHRQEVTRVLVTKLDVAGQAITVDAAKRTEALVKASVPFSTRQAKHEAAHGPTTKTAKSASGTEKKTAAPKKAAAPKKTATKKKD